MCVRDYHFFVDADLISQYITEKNSAMSEVRSFVEFQRYHFLYTDTIKKQMLSRKQDIPSIFKYVTDETISEVRHQVLTQLQSMPDLGKDPIHSQKLIDDFMMVYEASFIGTDWSLLPPGVQVFPRLLVMNEIVTRHRQIAEDNYFWEQMQKVLITYPYEFEVIIINFDDAFKHSPARFDL
jgi:hypothetical protein